MINWLKVGWQMATLLITLGIGALLFRKLVTPTLNEMGEVILEGQVTITNLAKLAGVKSQEYAAGKALEKVVATDLIASKLPELEALQFILSPDAWEKVEATIEDNPEAILQLYEKYKDYFPGDAAQKQLTTDY